MGRQVHAVPNEWGLVTTCQVGSGVADWPPAQLLCTISPFIKPSPGCRLREELFQRSMRSWCTFSISNTDSSMYTWFFLHFYLLHTALFQSRWHESMCVPWKYSFVLLHIYWKDLRFEFHLSFSEFHDCKKPSNLPQEFCLKGVQILSKQTLICSQSHLLVHPEFIYAEYHFRLSLYLSTFTFLFVVSRPFIHLIKRWDSPL